ncbi:DUF6176 family protein [Acinetobacter boissieri]|uniref:Uncharacterized protein n=1 Tax=Acinetobacter boissieri TaxID=1219383 RepID=A0A1G6GKA3_9GAMM|nr:DUF6176 family protein [Acinetobacter boissieri]SDB82462.1 hypothetical protein SAMN05421733_101329 [Acinetobacter boissieri]
MDVGAVLIKLKPNTLSNVNEWKENIQARKEEAVQTLKAEGVCVESWFHIELDGQDYLLAYMRANDIAQAQNVAKTSTFDIDQMHKKFKDCWERKYTATLLIDLENN